jgi:beta-aspartyl-peptidase (threonine type)
MTHSNQFCTATRTLIARARQVFILALLLTVLPAPWHLTLADTEVAIAIHGGAGTISRAALTPEQEAAFRAALDKAVRAGHAVLSEGGSSLSAVRTAINILEDSPLFNAGKGAVFNAAGVNELDASIMDGATRNAGAVSSVQQIRNPIDLAIAVMENSPHVMLSGQGAEEFAVEQGFALVERDYFHTEFRWEALQKAQARALDGQPQPQSFFSTVGAVALDRAGKLAAGTSTGGMTNKRFGRVGDSPIIGAGTFADNNSCAVSATGHGEYFIRWVVAYNICNRVANGASMAQAADEVVMQQLVEAGGTGGVISMDAGGNIAMPFNTAGMYRASIDTAGKVSVAIYGDE